MSGKLSPLLKSLIACAVLKAELGYQTCPASWTLNSVESGLAGSAGIKLSTVRVSTPMTPIGIPPRRARPTTTPLAHPDNVSWKEPLSKRPVSKSPLSSSRPSIIQRTS